MKEKIPIVVFGISFVVGIPVMLGDGMDLMGAIFGSLLSAGGMAILALIIMGLIYMVFHI